MSPTSTTRFRRTETYRRAVRSTRSGPAGRARRQGPKGRCHERPEEAASQDRLRDRMAGRTRKTACQGEGADAGARCAGGGAAQAADGADRQGLRPRRNGRQGEPARPVPGAPPAPPLPLHVRTQSRGGLLHVCRPGRPPRASQRARHLVRRRLQGADRQDRGLPTAHGMDFPVGVLDRHRFQPRLRPWSERAAAEGVPGREV